jgi:hypothetical protein
MAASYSVKGDVFAADKPRSWVGNYSNLSLAAGSGFDISADGKRLAAVLPVQASGPAKTDHEVAFVENFFDELRRRVPAGK